MNFQTCNTEIGAVLAELGRQPRFARKWLIKYQDRIMFGKDTWRTEEYGIYFRILETDDDYVNIIVADMLFGAYMVLTYRTKFCAKSTTRMPFVLYPVLINHSFPKN